jgi:hypothetical protein
VIRSSLLDRSTLEDSLAIYFIFSEPYRIFYLFLKFIRIFEIIKENEKTKLIGEQCWAIFDRKPSNANTAL